MACVQVIPSALFLDVLKELSELPDAPASVKNSDAPASVKNSDAPASVKNSDAPGIVKNSGETKAKKNSKISLSTGDIKWCHNKIKERGIPHRIHQLLNGSEVVLPKYEPPARSPELEERVQRLKAEQANREYRRMTKNLVVNQFEAASLKGLGNDIKEFKIQMKEMNRYIITGIQFLTTVVGTFFAIFVGLGYVQYDFGVRVLFATFCTVVVALAEIYFIIRQDIEEENQREKKLS